MVPGKSGLIIQEPAKRGLNPVAQGGLNATGKIDLPVERGQELNGLQPSMVLIDRAPIADEFVDEVLKRMSQLLKTLASLGRDPASNHGLLLNCRCFGQERKMTVLNCQPFIFHDRKILTVIGAYVFDGTQKLAIWIGGWPICFLNQRNDLRFSKNHVTRLTNIP